MILSPLLRVGFGQVVLIIVVILIIIVVTRIFRNKQ